MLIDVQQFGNARPVPLQGEAPGLLGAALVEAPIEEPLAEPVDPLSVFQDDPILRNQVAEKLCREIEASDHARGDLPNRWKNLEAMDAVAPGVTSLNIAEGMETYNIALWPPKCDRIVGAIKKSLFGPSPVVQCLDDAQGGINADDVERALEALAMRSGLRNEFSIAARVSANTNNAVLRVRPVGIERLDGTVDTKEDGSLHVARLEVDHIHPRDFCCYPSHLSPDKAKTSGHRFYRMAYEVDAKMRSEEWFTENLSARDDPRDAREGKNPEVGRLDLTQRDEPASRAEGSVELWELLTVLTLPNGEAMRCLCTVARTNRKLLNIEPYPYPKVWYVVLRTMHHDGGIWAINSLAQRVQGHSQAYSDGMNMALQGGWSSAFPKVIVSGGVLSDKITKLKPGSVLETSQKLDVNVISTAFNPSVVMAVIAEIKEGVDALTGISQVGTGEALNDATATEVDALISAQGEAKASYTDEAAQCLEEVYGLFLMLLQFHFQDLKETLGDAIPIQSFEQIASLSPRLEATGRSAASSPGVTLAKFRQLLELAQDPRSGLDVRKIIARIIGMLELPINAEDLLLDGQSPQELAALIIGLIEGQVPSEVAQQRALEVLNGDAAGGGGVLQEPAMAPNGGGAPGGPQGNGGGPNPALSVA